MASTQAPNDVPHIIVFPPIIPVATLVFALALQWLHPLGLLSRLVTFHRLVGGGIVCVLGVALLLGGAYELSRHGTHVRPSLPTLKLVTTGVYRWTRNPFYVGGSAALLGIALATGLDWVPILYLGSFVLLHFGIVVREEEYLQQKFGDAFEAYKAAVPRYLWPF
jgi:protein-S-isoprenylcysteine O-methyltransferase Ste14